MTTLAAIQGDGWCVLGADSQASDESGFTMEIVTGKIFANGPVVIAGAGSVRGINLLQFGFEAPKYIGKSTDHYMTRTFIPAMREFFIKSGYDFKSDTEAAGHDSEFLIAVKGVLYGIADDYSWERCARGIYISGTGGKYALGALAILKADKAESPNVAQSALRRAIKEAIRWDAYSGGNIKTVVQFA